MTKIKEALVLDMQSAFKMLKEAVSRIEGEFWKEEKNNWRYGTFLWHAIETIDFYMSDSAEAFHPLSEASDKTLEEEIEIINSKDKLFFEKFLADVESKTFNILEEMSEKDLLEKDGFEKMGFISRLHKYLYMIRHTMVHLGELSKTLRDKDGKGIRWE